MTKRRDGMGTKRVYSEAAKSPPITNADAAEILNRRYRQLYPGLSSLADRGFMFMMAVLWPEEAARVEEIMSLASERSQGRLPKPKVERTPAGKCNSCGMTSPAPPPGLDAVDAALSAGWGVAGMPLTDGDWCGRTGSVLYKIVLVCPGCDK